MKLLFGFENVKKFTQSQEGGGGGGGADWLGKGGG